jgi:probable F420-dependent oxidoreductase
VAGEPPPGEGRCHVRIGIVVQFNDLTPSVLDVAPALEARGVESLWMGEHTHLPVDTTHRYTKGKYRERKWGEEGAVPDFYRRMADPYTTLAAAAAVTTRLRLGTCIALPAEYNPIILAKQIATLDRISGGRLELDLGYGWNPLETENNGVNYDDRREVLRENLLAMEALWDQETASFDGEFVKFTESWSWPKPVQRPRPPIRLGAAPSERTFRHIVEFCDGWSPVRDHVGDALPSAMADLRHQWEDAGRDPAKLTIDLVQPPSTMEAGAAIDEFVRRLPGPELLESYRELGLNRVLIPTPGDTLEMLTDALDQMAASHFGAYL